jgi:hypothetical protein
MVTEVDCRAILEIPVVVLPLFWGAKVSEEVNPTLKPMQEEPTTAVVDAWTRNRLSSPSIT